MDFLFNFILLKFQNAKDVEAFKNVFSYTVMIITGGALHSFYALYYLVTGVYFLAIYDALSAVLYFSMIILCKNNYFKFINFCSIIEVSFYCILSVVMLGSGHNSNLIVILVLLPQYLFFSLEKTEKIIYTSIVGISFLISTLVPYYIEEQVLIKNPVFFTIFNTIFIFTCMLIELSMNSIISKIVSILNVRDLERFKHFSYVDPLTGLRNRRYADIYFERILHKEFKDINLNFAMVDIDNFKKINDTYRHDFGDVVLKGIGGLINSRFRQTDLLCRWGGEEFLIIVFDCEFETACKIFENFRIEIENNVFKREEIEVNVTVTIGISVLVEGDPQKTIEACDKKLYEGKKNGKNKIVY